MKVLKVEACVSKRLKEILHCAQLTIVLIFFFIPNGLDAAKSNASSFQLLQEYDVKDQKTSTMSRDFDGWLHEPGNGCCKCNYLTIGGCCCQCPGCVNSSCSCAVCYHVVIAVFYGCSCVTHECESTECQGACCLCIPWCCPPFCDVLMEQRFYDFARKKYRDDGDIRPFRSYLALYYKQDKEGRIYELLREGAEKWNPKFKDTLMMCIGKLIDDACCKLDRGVKETYLANFLITAINERGRAEYPQVVDLLLSMGADPNRSVTVRIKNLIITTGNFLTFALIRERSDTIMQLLLRAGADLDVAGSEGRTPRMFAIEKNRHNIIAMAVEVSQERHAIVLSLLEHVDGAFNDIGALICGYLGEVKMSE